MDNFMFIQSDGDIAMGTSKSEQSTEKISHLESANVFQGNQASANIGTTVDNLIFSDKDDIPLQKNKKREVLPPPPDEVWSTDQGLQSTVFLKQTEQEYIHDGDIHTADDEISDTAAAVDTFASYVEDIDTAARDSYAPDVEDIDTAARDSYAPDVEDIDTAARHISAPDIDTAARDISAPDIDTAARDISAPDIDTAARDISAPDIDTAARDSGASDVEDIDTAALDTTIIVKLLSALQPLVYALFTVMIHLNDSDSLSYICGRLVFLMQPFVNKSVRFIWSNPAVVILLMFMTVMLQVVGSDETFLLCHQPGTCMRGQLFEAEMQTCLPCPNGTWNAQDNHACTSCKTCTRPRKYQKVITPCTATSDTKIACQEGSEDARRTDGEVHQSNQPDCRPVKGKITTVFENKFPGSTGNLTTYNETTRNETTETTGVATGGSYFWPILSLSGLIPILILIGPFLGFIRRQKRRGVYKISRSSGSGNNESNGLIESRL